MSRMNATRSFFLASVGLVCGFAGWFAASSSAGGCAPQAAPKTFEGYSSDLTFDKAIADAVSKAWAELSKSPDWPKADGMLRFTVSEIGGERGGFAGFNRLRVKITVSP
jgi:hypothetical protein